MQQYHLDCHGEPIYLDDEEEEMMGKQWDIRFYQLQKRSYRVNIEDPKGRKFSQTAESLEIAYNRCLMEMKKRPPLSYARQTQNQETTNG